MLKWLKLLWARMFRRNSADPWIQADSLKKERSPRRTEDEIGVHYYLGDLLDHMDAFFADVDALRRANRDVFDAHRGIGIGICSKRLLFSGNIQPWVMANAAPAFACAYVHSDDDPGDDTVTISFMYARKLDRPINVQLSNGQVYEVGGVYRYSNKARTPVCIHSYVSLLPDGTCIALKELVAEPLTDKRGRRIAVRGVWRHSELWTSGKFKIGDKNANATLVVAVLFNMAYACESGIKVVVRKNNQSAVFGIDMLRTPYFFADRDKVVNEHGRTKQIFHIVRAHHRNGKIVKTHFRGLRSFMWNGYSVRIGMPGKHMPMLSEFGAAGFNDDRDAGETLSSFEVGERLGAIAAQ